jgi:glutamate/tyrosine decarboxylase-like PLP-dependent enzyme
VHAHESNRRLELTPDEMRDLGYRAVDMVVSHLATLREQSVGRTAPRAELEKLLREPPPEHPAPPLDVLEALGRGVLPNTLHVNHPRFFGFIPSPGNYVSAVADFLAAGFNVFAGTWLAGSGVAEIELVTVDWLRQFCGLPETAGGLFVSGGSVANLTGLAVARQVRLGGRTAGAVVYYSDQTHSAVERGLRTMGFEPPQLRKIPADPQLRLSPETVRREIAEDRAAGRLPFCLVANVGTTNTGAVDPLPELAALCRDERLWLHADGAYGAAAALSPRARPLLAGLEQADSLALDPHKWLFQPFEIGCLLVRQAGWLRQTFTVHPEYMKDTFRAEEEPNFCEWGVQLTRSTRALKLWMSLKVFGVDAFRRAITAGLELAELAEAELRNRPGWRIVTPAQLAIVSFRYEPSGMPAQQSEAINHGLAQRMREDGFALLTSTVLDGRTVLRLCTINPRTTRQDILETIERLTQVTSDK